MNLQQAYELSNEINNSIGNLTICLEEYNPGRCCDTLTPLSALSFDVAIMISKLEHLRNIISDESLKTEV